MIDPVFYSVSVKYANKKFAPTMTNTNYRTIFYDFCKEINKKPQKTQKAYDVISRNPLSGRRHYLVTYSPANTGKFSTRELFAEAFIDEFNNWKSVLKA